MISNRYDKANNPYVPGFDSTQEKNYNMYLDANNLSGWAMSQPLSTHDFFWLMEQEIEELNVMSIPNDGEDGYTLEVDLEYPQRTPRSPLGLSPSARDDESDPKHAVSLLSAVGTRLEPGWCAST